MTLVHGNFSICVDKAMNDSGSPNQVALDQSYDRRGPGPDGSPRAVGNPGDIIKNLITPLRPPKLTYNIFCQEI